MVKSFFGATVFDSKIAEAVPFVYLISFKTKGPLGIYIGQTRGRLGAIGRLSQHLSPTSSGTLCKRIKKVFRVDQIANFHADFVAYPLTGKREYSNKNREYREAVESNVQLGMMNLVAGKRYTTPIISRIKPNPYCSIPFVQDDSNKIIDVFFEWFQNKMK